MQILPAPGVFNFFTHLKQHHYMKQVLSMACIIFLLASCNNETKDAAKEATETATPAAAVTLPYTPDKPYRNWQMGSEQNTLLAMTALKAWENKDYAGLASSLGDSVEIRMDGYSEKLNRDSAVSFFKTARENYAAVTITMYDWESVISADKKAEYVTLWYKQAWTDNKGVKDSLSVIDDVKIANGKMIELDEKVQRFPKK
jgi:hypothetical protein